MKIIVNADDYGHDRNRTEAIRECFRRGLVNRTTAMVNMPYFPVAIEGARQDGFVNKIGLHLNMTFGRPLTSNIRRSRLFCNEDGFFNARFHFNMATRFFLPDFERRAVADEAVAQMQKYRDFNLNLLHLDSHHHIHTDPAIARIVLPLAKGMGFKTVRMTRNIPFNLGFAKKVYKWYVRSILHRSGLETTDYFGSNHDARTIADKFSCSEGSLEIMVHPLYCSSKDMDLNMEWDSTDGPLNDGREPISTIEWINENSILP